jgi:hypothetical protein
MTIPFQTFIILPFAVVGLLMGWRRGWIEEIITTLFLIITLGLFGSTNRVELFASLINGIVDVFGRFFGAIIGADFETPDLVRTDNLLIQFLLYVLIVIIAYLVGSAFGSRRSVGRPGRLGGALLGAVNVFLVGSQVVNFINRARPSWLQQEIIITQDGGTNSLIRYLPTILTIAVLIGIIAFFLNLRERRR